jgi:hypothetical protein
MAGELRAVAKKVKTLPQQMVKAGTSAVEKPLQAAYMRDSGGDGRLSGLRNSGTFKAKSTMKGTASVTGRVTIGPPSMRGPATWLNDGAKRRIVGRTVAKHTFDHAADSSLPKARVEMEKIFGKAFD